MSVEEELKKDHSDMQAVVDSKQKIIDAQVSLACRNTLIGSITWSGGFRTVQFGCVAFHAVFAHWIQGDVYLITFWSRRQSFSCRTKCLRSQKGKFLRSKMDSSDLSWKNRFQIFVFFKIRIRVFLAAIFSQSQTRNHPPFSLAINANWLTEKQRS